jgi:ribosome-binding protein aMBF1 (putative translation factor)
MIAKGKDYAALVRKAREQLGLSQEDFAHQLGVSFATINRWENEQVKPSRLARVQIDSFCAKMTEAGKLKLPRNEE